MCVYTSIVNEDEIEVSLKNVEAIEFCVRSTGQRYLKVVPHVQKRSKMYEDCHHNCVRINGKVFGDSQKRLLSMFGLDKDMSRSFVSKYCMVFNVNQCLMRRSTADEESFEDNSRLDEVAAILKIQKLESCCGNQLMCIPYLVDCSRLLAAN